jgi:flavorubredoxin
MAKALIVYATKSGQTQKIANFVAEGMKVSGMDATVISAVEIKDESDLAPYDSLVIGSATYHGEMMHSAKALLTMARKIRLGGKAGGAFGAYGWSGEAPDQIFDRMKNFLKMDMVDGPLKLKSAVVTDSEEIAKDYGRAIAQKLGF